MANEGNKPRFNLRAAGAGALAGAIVVGAVWAIVSFTHGSDPAIASLNGQTIHRSTLQQQLDTEYGTQTLQNIITSHLIEAEAKAQGLTASKSEITTAENNIEAQYGISGSAQLTSFLAANGMSKSQFDSLLKDQVLEQKLAEKGVTVSNKEITDYYNANKASFTPQGSKTPQPLSQVRSQIVTAIKQSKATPPAQLFATLAKKYNLTILNSKYKSVKTALENPSTGLPSSGAPSSGPAPSSSSGAPSSSGGSSKTGSSSSSGTSGSKTPAPSKTSSGK